MRKSRFAAAVAAPAETREVSISQALFFDLKPADNDDDHAIATQRLTSLRHVPVMLGLVHLLSIVAVLIHFGFSVPGNNPTFILNLVLFTLALDGGAAAYLWFKEQRNWTPRTSVAILCAYSFAVSFCWALFSHVSSWLPGLSSSGLLPLVVGAGVTASAVVVIGSPPLAIVTALAGTVSAALFSNDSTVTAGIAAVSLVLVGYSALTSQTMIIDARRRMLLDREARKTLHFVAEFENSGRGWFWETDPKGTLSYVSWQLAEDFDCTPDALIGRQFTDLMSVDSSGLDSLREERTLGFHLSARFPFSDVVVRAASDRDVHWSLSGNPIFDERGRFLGFRGIGTDLTEQRRSEQEISRLARFDSLTGLPNRALMRQTLDEALRNASRRQKGCTLFLIDLDRFKNVNDTLGHPVGDTLLRQVAQRLTSVMGENGQIGRLGGDEFKAVLPGIVETGLIESLARTLIDQVSRPYEIEGHRVTIGASVGIAIGDPGRSCADSLIRNADLALYAAKAAGRGKHMFYQPSMHSEASDRQVMENDLRGAIDRGELWVAFQPIVGAAGENLCGFEALVRWNHPTRGPVGPDKFIPLAEECGMVPKIGAFVLDEALKTAAHWPDAVKVAVNLSPIQFNHPGIVDQVGAALARHQVRAGRLELEITEGVFLGDNEEVENTFTALKSLGVRLALDDFGTGYSSLGYLKKAPFDKIKIDQSFVRGAAASGARNGAIIRAIVTLAETLGMDTTAEGVETHDDLHLIRELGVSQVQGYIFGKPVDAEGASTLAAQQTIEADGYQSIREPRQRLMRRAIAAIDGHPTEIRLRNISAKGALVECHQPVAPGEMMTIDIVGVGPVIGTVRWAQSGKFGVQFTEMFDLARLAPKVEKKSTTTMLTPWYLAEHKEMTGGR